MSLWQLFFGWPAGGVWPNLLASAITAPLGAAGGAGLVWWRARKHLRAQHEAHAAELAAHREDVGRQLAEHYEKVLQAVGGAAGGS